MLHASFDAPDDELVDPLEPPESPLPEDDAPESPDAGFASALVVESLVESDLAPL